jgi:hypothetical protein
MALNILANSKNIEIDIPKALISCLRRGPNGLFFAEESLAEMSTVLKTINKGETLFAIFSEFIVFAGFLHQQNNAVFAAKQLLDLVDAAGASLADIARGDLAILAKIDRLHAVSAGQRKALEKKPATVDALQSITSSGIGLRNTNKS